MRSIRTVAVLTLSTLALASCANAETGESEPITATTGPTSIITGRSRRRGPTPAAEMRALREAHANVVAYNRRGLPPAWKGRNRHGAIVGEKHDPIRRVGLYVPGGGAPLVSTLIMLAEPARVAAVAYVSGNPIPSARELRNRERFSSPRVRAWFAGIGRPK